MKISKKHIIAIILTTILIYLIITVLMEHPSSVPTNMYGYGY